MKQFFYALVRKLTRWAWFDVVAKAELKAKHYERESLKLDKVLCYVLRDLKSLHQHCSKGSLQHVGIRIIIAYLEKLKQQ